MAAIQRAGGASAAPAALFGIFTPFFTFARDFINGRRGDVASVAKLHHPGRRRVILSCADSNGYLLIAGVLRR
jgi:hypothetical protein